MNMTTTTNAILNNTNITPDIKLVLLTLIQSVDFNKQTGFVDLVKLSAQTGLSTKAVSAVLKFLRKTHVFFPLGEEALYFLHEHKFVPELIKHLNNNKA